MILMPILLLLLRLLLAQGCLSPPSPFDVGQVDKRSETGFGYTSPLLGDTATTIPSIHPHIQVCLVY